MDAERWLAAPAHVLSSQLCQAAPCDPGAARYLSMLSRNGSSMMMGVRVSLRSVCVILVRYSFVGLARVRMVFVNIAVRDLFVFVFVWLV